MNQLTKGQESFCENAGLFGILLSVACLIQHLMYMESHWVMFVLAALYGLPIITFDFLMKKKHVAGVLLVVSTSVVFLMEILVILSLFFSLVLILLFLYLLVIMILFYVDNIAKHLKIKEVAEKEEAAKWNGII